MNALKAIGIVGALWIGLLVMWNLATIVLGIYGSDTLDTLASLAALAGAVVIYRKTFADTPTPSRVPDIRRERID